MPKSKIITGASVCKVRGNDDHLELILDYSDDREVKRLLTINGADMLFHELKNYIDPVTLEYVDKSVSRLPINLALAPIEYLGGSYEWEIQPVEGFEYMCEPSSTLNMVIKYHNHTGKWSITINNEQVEKLEEVAAFAVAVAQKYANEYAAKEDMKPIVLYDGVHEWKKGVCAYMCEVTELLSFVIEHTNDDKWRLITIENHSGIIKTEEKLEHAVDAAQAYTDGYAERLEEPKPIMYLGKSYPWKKELAKRCSFYTCEFSAELNFTVFKETSGTHKGKWSLLISDGMVYQYYKKSLADAVEEAQEYLFKT